MGSTRLPGKVLLRIEGKSILERSVQRLREAQSPDDVVILTTTLEEDDEIAGEARRLGAPVFRGPSLDVLKRFQQAAEHFRPEIVVRATADNPLIEIASVDRIVRALRTSDLEYCMEIELPYGAATEAISVQALRKSDQLAKLARHREHVTLFAKENPERFRLAFLSPPDALHRPEIRLTVDTWEDFMFMEDLIRSVPEPAQPHPLERYLDAAADLARTRS
jgi:spore coat polysaccharide biosynthesis protein SpsF